MSRAKEDHVSTMINTIEELSMQKDWDGVQNTLLAIKDSDDFWLNSDFMSCLNKTFQVEKTLITRSERLCSMYYRVVLYFFNVSIQTSAFNVAENHLFSLVSLETTISSCSFGKNHWWRAFHNYAKGQICASSAALLLRKKLTAADDVPLFSHCAVYYALALQFLEPVDVAAIGQPDLFWWSQNVFFCKLEADVLLEKMKAKLQSKGALCDVGAHYATAEGLLKAFSLVFPSKFLSKMTKNCLLTTLSRSIVDIRPMPRHEFDLYLREFMRLSSTPDALGRVLWIFKDFWNSELVCLDCSEKFQTVISQLFDGLQRFPPAFRPADISSISLLDIFVFLNRCAVGLPRTTDVSKLPYVPGDGLANKWEKDWYTAVLRLCRDAASGQDRLRVSEGLHVLRLCWNPEPDVPFLISTVTLLDRLMAFMRQNNVSRQDMIHVSDYAVEYWKVLSKFVCSSRLPYPKTRVSAAYPTLTATDRDLYVQLCRYNEGINDMLHGVCDRAIGIFEQLQTPLAIYGQYQVFKNKAQDSLCDPNVSSTERRSFLKKALKFLEAFEERVAENFSTGRFSVPISELDKERTAIKILVGESELPVRKAKTVVVHDEPAPGSTSPDRGGDFGNVSRAAPSGTASEVITAAVAELLRQEVRRLDQSTRSRAESSSSEVKTLADTLNTSMHVWATTMQDLSVHMVDTLRQLADSNKSLAGEIVRLRNLNLNATPPPASTIFHPFAGVVPHDLSNVYSAAMPLGAAGVLPTLPSFQPSPSAQMSRPVCSFSPSFQSPEPVTPLQNLLIAQRYADAAARALLPSSRVDGDGYRNADVSRIPQIFPKATASVSTDIRMAAGETGGPFVRSHPGFGSPFYPTVTSTVSFGFGAAPADSSVVVSVATCSAATSVTMKTEPASVPSTSFFSSTMLSNDSSGIAYQTCDESAIALSPASVEGGRRDSAVSVPEDYGEAKDDFVPVVQLPEVKDLKTGEEEEMIIFKAKVKLYRRDSEAGVFKERGVGELKILKHVATGKTRLVMRREAIHKLCANHYLKAGMKLWPMSKTPRALVWHCDDFADEVLKPEVLAAKFKTVDQAAAFKEAFEKCVGRPKDDASCAKTVPEEKKPESPAVFSSSNQTVKSPERPKTVSSTTTVTSSTVAIADKEMPCLETKQTTGTTSFFQTPKFTFATTTSSKEQAVKMETAAKPVNAIFAPGRPLLPPAEAAVSEKKVEPRPALTEEAKSITTSTPGTKPSIFGQSKPKLFPGSCAAVSEPSLFDESKLVVSCVPSVSPVTKPSIFAPPKFVTPSSPISPGSKPSLLSAPKVGVSVAEISGDSKPSIFAPLKFVSPPPTIPETRPSLSGKPEVEVIVSETPADSKPSIFAAPKFVPTITAADSKISISAAQKSLPPTSGTSTEPKPSLVGESDASSSEATASIFSSPKFVLSGAPVSSETKSTIIGESELFSTSATTTEAKPSIFSESKSVPSPPETKPSIFVEAKPPSIGAEAKTSLFGASKTDVSVAAACPVLAPVTTASPSTASSTKVFQPSGPMLSFSALSAQQQPDFGHADSKGSGFQDAGRPLFASYRPSEGEKQEASADGTDGSADATAYEPEIEFQPAIPLPNLVEVKTGEEDEEVLFKARSKLFRYCQDPPEFKERGIGELKVLKHRVSGKIRIVMRREQVLKLCANHYLTSDMKLVAMAKKPNAFTWSCNDFAEEVLQRELFAVKFKSDKDANDFKQCFDDCVRSLAKSPPPEANKEENADEGVQKGGQLAADSTPLNLMDKFKPKAGSWTCSGCLVLNEDTVTTCCCCTKPRSSPTTSSSSVEVAAVTKPETFTFGTAATPDTKSPEISGFSFGLKKEPLSQAAVTTASTVSPSSDAGKFQFGGFSGSETGKVGSAQFSFGVATFSPSNKKPSSPVDEKNVSTLNKSKDNEEAEESAETSCEPHCEPLITLSEVEVKTGEENENEMFSMHCKLYRFSESQWKERGVGHLRFLQHKQTSKGRVVMRHEQTLKVCLNHAWPPTVQLAFRDEQSWMWAAQDFSDGTGKETMFCARFKDKEDAKVFKARADEITKSLPADLKRQESRDKHESPAGAKSTVAFSFSPGRANSSPNSSVDQKSVEKSPGGGLFNFGVISSPGGKFPGSAVLSAAQFSPVSFGGFGQGMAQPASAANSPVSFSFKAPVQTCASSSPSSAISTLFGSPLAADAKDVKDQSLASFSFAAAAKKDSPSPKEPSVAESLVTHGDSSKDEYYFKEQCRMKFVKPMSDTVAQEGFLSLSRDPNDGKLHCRFSSMITNVVLFDQEFDKSDNMQFDVLFPSSNTSVLHITSADISVKFLFFTSTSASRIQKTIVETCEE